ncbi:YecA family protein [Pseudomonas alabamensis]|uniref:YecA family protein n=1 Tax=Pseudomonas alabamensis TaxID=3064349 RepID=UPI003F651877
MKKIGRNVPCPCESGLKYKYCCISKEERPRIIKIKNSRSDCGLEKEVDLSSDYMNILARSRIPLLNFFKDNDLYFFGTTLTIGDSVEFNELLKSGTLTKTYLVERYIQKLKYEDVIFYIDDAATMHSTFESRKRILKDAVEAHFNGKYTLSVPVLFAQVEGILREYGGMNLADKFRPNVSTQIWNSRLLFNTSDDAQYFNVFISKIFEGQQSQSSFNRNPILHGMSVNYDSQEWSTVLILIILEIRNFVWLERNTQSLIPDAI